MAWRDTLEDLEAELAEMREERLRQAKAEEAERQKQREQLSQLAASLEISHLLEEMNSILLKKGGQIEMLPSWEATDEEEEEDIGLPPLFDDTEDDEDADYISFTLSWEEDGEREIVVDLGISDEGTYLLVNGEDTRPERNALERALVEAFRQEIEL
jgi:hypothetical protein